MQRSLEIRQGIDRPFFLFLHFDREIPTRFADRKVILITAATGKNDLAIILAIGLNYVHRRRVILVAMSTLPIE